MTRETLDYDPEDIEIEAKVMAFDAHIGQMYGSHDYSVHLVHVTDTLLRFGFDDPILLAAGWLHDALEDTDLTREQIEATCGQRVAEIVWRVTDEPGKNRRERKRLTYPKIAGSQDALVIKLADRIANVSESFRNNTGLLEMYKKEYPEFSNTLRKFGSPLDEMWEWLDRVLIEGKGIEQ